MLVIAAGTLVAVLLGAILVLLWARRSHTPWCELGYVRPKTWIGSLAIGIVFGSAFKLLMKSIVMPLLGADPINPTYHYLAANAAALPEMLFAAIVVAGFAEETVFRGYLFERLGKLWGTRVEAKMFHRCLPALAQAGNNLIVEHIVETRTCMSRLVQLLEPLDVFFVGIHCPLSELEKRELQRGDRRVGEARQDYDVVHTFGTYDIEIDSIQHLEDNVKAVVKAWQSRTYPSAFERMMAAEREGVQNAP